MVSYIYKYDDSDAHWLDPCLLKGLDKGQNWGGNNIGFIICFM